MRLLLVALVVTFLIPAFSIAMTMTEAVDQALTHNPRIQQYISLGKASAARADKAESPFWPSLHAGYQYSDADDKYGYATTDQSSVSAALRYNLFNGGSDWFGTKAADHQAAAAHARLRSTVSDVVLEVQRAFINRLRAERNLATEQQAVQLLERQQRDSELRLQEGLIARNDLLRVEVELAIAQQKQMSAEGALRIAGMALSQVIGQPLPADLQLADFTSLPAEPALPVNELIEVMLASRDELRYLKQQLAAQISGRRAVGGELLPEIDLVFSYEEFGNGGLPENDDIDFNRDSRTMVEANWTLFSGFDTRYELASRKHEIDALRREIKATEDLLTLQLQTGIEEFKVATGNLVTAQVAEAQAEENYRVNENRYKAQVATTVDLLDAQELLTRARNEQIKARYDLHLAAAVLDRVIGKPIYAKALSQTIEKQFPEN